LVTRIVAGQEAFLLQPPSADQLNRRWIQAEAGPRIDRSLHRIGQPERAAAYLRTIVLNLARDHNRRGLVSLRHRLPEDRQRWSPVEDDLIVREDQLHGLNLIVPPVIGRLQTLNRRLEQKLLEALSSDDTPVGPA
jgi:DNA-directed RNA polymerase specialized sigma24 family protein